MNAFGSSRSGRIQAILVSGALLISLIAVAPVAAQGPLEALQGNNLSRLPDDQVEGTIWEYKAELTSGDKKEVDGELTNEMEGTFRFEDQAIFDVGGRIKLPSRKQVESFVESAVAGNPRELKLPGPPKQKRIGEYRLSSRNKLRLDLDDEKSLFGVMVLRRKKNTSDVWQGTFQEKEGKKTVRKWKVEIRPIED